MKVEEPSIAYNTPSIQNLKNRLITAIDCSRDEECLHKCLKLLEASASPKPCVFTEEEFDEEIKFSEASGYATDSEVTAMYAKWGVVI